MKKNIFFILLFVFIIFSVFITNYFRYGINKNKVLQENKEYISDEGKTVQINKVVTLMNKAIESNQRNDIKRDDKGMFIENDSNSIRIFIEIESRGSVIPMEDLILSDKGGTETVEKLFSDLFFEYKEVEYHEKTGYIKKIVFKAIEDIEYKEDNDE